MRFTFDPEADASYVSLLDRDLRRGEAAQQSDIINTPSGAGSVIVDYNKDGRILGFEILFCSAVLPVEVLENIALDRREESGENDSHRGASAVWRVLGRRIRKITGSGD